MQKLRKLMLSFLIIFSLFPWLILSANDNNESISLSERLAKLNDGDITTVIGNPLGEGELAKHAAFNYLTNITSDKQGNLFLISDFRIRKIDAITKIITTVAGGRPGISQDGVLALGAAIDAVDLVVDRKGNIIFSEFGDKVRMIDAKTNLITTIAGNGIKGFDGDGGPAINASLNSPTALAIDKENNLFIADSGNNCVRKVDPTGIITRIAGNGESDYSGDQILASQASIKVEDIKLDKIGNLFIAGNNRVYKVNKLTNVITTVVGDGDALYNGEGDGDLATKASLEVKKIELDRFNNIFVLESATYRPRIRKVNAKTGIINTVAGNGCTVFNGCNPNNGKLATEASFLYLNDFTLDNKGDLYVTEYLTDDHNNRSYLSDHLRKVDSQTGIISIVTSNYTPNFENASALQARLCLPEAIVVDSLGNIFTSNKCTNTIQRVDAKTQIIKTFAGNGIKGFSGDGDFAINASFSSLSEIIVDQQGNLLIADTDNNRIRRIDVVTGIIATIAGNGKEGYDGDGQLAINSSLNKPSAIAFDREENLFILDGVNERIRRVDKNTGIITSVFVDDTEGESIYSLAIDSVGNIYSITTDQFILKLDRQTNKVTYTELSDFIGNSSFGLDLVTDKKANIYLSTVTDIFPFYGGVVKINITDKQKTALVSTKGFFAGDNGPAKDSSVQLPRRLAFDISDNLFIVDSGNQAIRAIKNPASIN